MDRWKEKGPIRRKIAARLAERKHGSSKPEEDGDGGDRDRPLEEEFYDLGARDETLDKDSEEPKRKPWLETNKEVYELQLKSMQEQLESAMCEKMELQGWPAQLIVVRTKSHGAIPD